jgi:hypothetical protein
MDTLSWGTTGRSMVGICEGLLVILVTVAAADATAYSSPGHGTHIVVVLSHMLDLSVHGCTLGIREGARVKLGLPSTSVYSAVGATFPSASVYGAVGATLGARVLPTVGSSVGVLVALVGVGVGSIEGTSEGLPVGAVLAWQHSSHVWPASGRRTKPSRQTHSNWEMCRRRIW